MRPGAERFARCPIYASLNLPLLGDIGCSRVWPPGGKIQTVSGEASMTAGWRFILLVTALVIAGFLPFGFPGTWAGIAGGLIFLCTFLWILWKTARDSGGARPLGG
jgi:hypothetical protein